MSLEGSIRHGGGFPVVVTLDGGWVHVEITQSDGEVFVLPLNPTMAGRLATHLDHASEEATDAH